MVFLCGLDAAEGRYVAVSKVLDTRRGRCGEYSVLMMRLLEALGYSCRWVVDWSDHVWVEAKVDGLGWVHVDPCEVRVCLLTRVRCVLCAPTQPELSVPCVGMGFSAKET